MPVSSYNFSLIFPFQQIRESFDFILEENRRKTFKKWIYSEKQVCNADKVR